MMGGLIFYGRWALVDRFLVRFGFFCGGLCGVWRGGFVEVAVRVGLAGEMLCCH